jgi:hypothetical protein
MYILITNFPHHPATSSLSYVKISSLARTFQTLSIYAIPLRPEIKFQSHTKR